MLTWQWNGDDMAEQLDRAGFDALLDDKCREVPELKEIVYALRRIAMSLGGVSEHAVQGEKGGWGTKFKIGPDLLCAADPKPRARHVGIGIPEADKKSLGGLGDVPVRKDTWVSVKTLSSGDGIDRMDLLTALVHARYEQLTGQKPERARVRPTVEAAKPSPWTPPELELVITDYFAMLDEEAADGADQAAHNRALVPLLLNRTMEAVESIRAQVSHVLLSQGLPYIGAHQPSEQTWPAFELLVLAYVDTVPAPPQPVAETASPMDFGRLHRLVEAPPPPAPAAREGRPAARMTVMGIDYPLRDAKNRELGIAGEQSVVDYERRRLVDEEHRPDLADQVEWVAQTRGDGLGYDVLSFDGDGQHRLIEVKTTRLPDTTAFYVTRNEVEVSSREAKRYHLYRVFDFDLNPRVFIRHGALAETCSLTPTVFSARVR